MAHALHIVCGLPASGKTTFATQLAKKINAALLDSDTATDLMVQAAHKAAGLDPHDRDSPLYKETYRLPVYETLFALAAANLPHTDVIIAGPFTTELKDLVAWETKLRTRFSPHPITIHHIRVDESIRLQQMKYRGAKRDKNKFS